MHRASIAAIAVTATVFSSSSARAQSFGDAGHLVVSGETQLQLERSTASVPSGAAPVAGMTSFLVSPALDYFVVRDLSIGAIALYAHSHEDGLAGTATRGASPAFDSDALSVGPRVGYNLRLSRDLSLWPTVLGAYGGSWYTNGSGEALRVGASVPVLFHPVPHFFVGVGPQIETDLTSKSSSFGVSSDGPRYTSYGVSLTLGGSI